MKSVTLFLASAVVGGLLVYSCANAEAIYHAPSIPKVNVIIHNPQWVQTTPNEDTRAITVTDQQGYDRLVIDIEGNIHLNNGKINFNGEYFYPDMHLYGYTKALVNGHEVYLGLYQRLIP